VVAWFGQVADTVAATAKVTRNEKDLEGSGVPVLDPFAWAVPACGPRNSAFAASH